MQLESLKHLLDSILTLTRAKTVYLFGSASLYASHPHLDHEIGLSYTTYDADVLVEPMTESVGLLLSEALGDKSFFMEVNGYHLDVLRSEFLETLPEGWRQRVVSMPGYSQVLALNPLDLVLVKLLLGREKDLRLIQELLRSGLMTMDQIRLHFQSTDMGEKEMIRVGKNLHQLAQFLG